MPRGLLQSQRAGFRDKQLTKNQMFGSRRTTSQRPLPKILPIYISWYINDYGRPRTSPDPSRR
jgi:hypothetical protein